MKILLLVSLSLFLASCDTLVLKGNGGEDTGTRAPAVSAGADFELAGERMETYYRVIDPEIRNRQLPGLYPKTKAGFKYSYHSSVETHQTYYNFVSSPSSWHDFYTPPYNIRLAGEATFYSNFTLPGVMYDEENMLIQSAAVPYYFNFSFDAKKALYDDLGVDFNILNEKVSVSRLFSGTSLELPETSSYSSAKREYLYKTLVFQTPTSFIRSLSDKKPEKLSNASFDIGDYGDEGYAITGSAIPNSLSVEIFEPFVLESRNFYQYKKISLKYRRGLEITDCEGQADVVENCGIDTRENVLTVTFRDYDEPYTGPVVTFRVRAEDMSVHEKTLTIK